jgi:hypothetical protein
MKTTLHTPVIPAIKRLRQEDLKFKANLSYIGRPCLKKKNTSFPHLKSKLVLPSSKGVRKIPWVNVYGVHRATEPSRGVQAMAARSGIGLGAAQW